MNTIEQESRRLPRAGLMPVMCGIMERRVLINYQVAPGMVERLLPAPFRPKLVRGRAVAGVCLIRLKDIRPRGLPAWCGLSFENAAHRFAVEWDDAGAVHEGVFIPRRDTSARFVELLGGRLFPGHHHPARFEVCDTGRSIKLSLRSRDGEVAIRVRARTATVLPADSVFESLAAATDFFRRGCTGYSATPWPGHFEGLELCCPRWEVEPLAVDHVHSSVFKDDTRFPRGTVRFDSAFVMRNLEHEWHALPSLRSALPSPKRRSPTQ